MVRQLRNSSDDGTVPNQAVTRGLGERFRSSEMTLVSSR
jgi:hypothetical protein